MDLSRFFKPSFTSKFTKQRTARVTPLLYALDYFAIENNLPRLTNAAAAAAIVDKYPDTETTSKSVASIRSKQKDEIVAYVLLRKSGSSHEEAYAGSKG